MLKTSLFTKKEIDIAIEILKWRIDLVDIDISHSNELSLRMSLKAEKKMLCNEIDFLKSVTFTEPSSYQNPYDKVTT